MRFLDFIRHQAIPIQSMSADIFSSKEDIYVAMAAPYSNSCVVMEWDHIEMNFRKFDNITGSEESLIVPYWLTHQAITYSTNFILIINSYFSILSPSPQGNRWWAASRW